MNPVFTITAELVPWSGGKGDSWIFLTVPQDESDEISELVPRKAGFGSVKVSCQVKGMVWQTSVFPDSKSGCFVLPIKKAVRDKANVVAGDSLTVELEVLLP